MPVLDIRIQKDVAVGDVSKLFIKRNSVALGVEHGLREPLAYGMFVYGPHESGAQSHSTALRTHRDAADLGGGASQIHYPRRPYDLPFPLAIANSDEEMRRCQVVRIKLLFRRNALLLDEDDHPERQNIRQIPGGLYGTDLNLQFRAF